MKLDLDKIEAVARDTIEAFEFYGRMAKHKEENYPEVAAARDQLALVARIRRLEVALAVYAEEGNWLVAENEVGDGFLVIDFIGEGNAKPGTAAIAALEDRDE